MKIQGAISVARRNAAVLYFFWNNVASLSTVTGESNVTCTIEMVPVSRVRMPRSWACNSTAFRKTTVARAYRIAQRCVLGSYGGFHIFSKKNLGKAGFRQFTPVNNLLDLPVFFRNKKITKQ